jgi:hypothetical protein
MNCPHLPNPLKAGVRLECSIDESDVESDVDDAGGDAAARRITARRARRITPFRLETTSPPSCSSHAAFWIRHHSIYSYDAAVWLDAHALRLRPRESHELRIEASWLPIAPTATLRWHRDAENNSLATGRFSESITSLRIESEVLIQQYNQDPPAT